MNYDKTYFNQYVMLIVTEMQKRGIKYNQVLRNEISDFCNHSYIMANYPEHNDRYLIQCYYNLQEKADREIISEEEWQKIKGYVNINYLIMCK